jgi:hypothetical protein
VWWMMYHFFTAVLLLLTKKIKRSSKERTKEVPESWPDPQFETRFTLKAVLSACKPSDDIWCSFHDVPIIITNLVKCVFRPFLHAFLVTFVVFL